MKSSRSISPGCVGRTVRSLVLGIAMLHLISVVVADLDVVGVPVLEPKQIRHWSLMEIEYCPLRSPPRAWSRLLGGSFRSSMRDA